MTVGGLYQPRSRICSHNVHSFVECLLQIHYNENDVRDGDNLLLSHQISKRVLKLLCNFHVKPDLHISNILVSPIPI